MNFIMIPLVTGIVTLGIYKFFELLICRRERREIIEKLEPGSLIDYLKLVPMGLRTGATIRTASETAPGIPAGALKVGCLLLGLGAGLLFGFMLTRITEIQSYDTRGVVYGGSVLVFGGLGLIVSFIIILVGFEFFKTSLDRILHPAAVAFSAVLMGILAVSMLVKLWMGAFNVNIGRRIDSPVLMAAGQDSRNDVITTAVVVLGMAAGRFTTLPVDGYVGVAVAAFILWSGIGIAKDTVAPLLGEAADPEVARNIRRIVMESDHIVGVHDMIIHNYGAGRSIASLHAEVPSDSDFVAVHEEIDEAEKRVWQQTGVYLVIHMDPIDINNAYVNALREQTDGVLRQIDGQLTMHDFRIVDGKRQINLIFDVVVPFSYDEDAKRDLLMKIYDGLKAIDSRYNPVVTLDHQM
mgnify:FL=1